MKKPGAYYAKNLNLVYPVYYIHYYGLIDGKKGVITLCGNCYRDWLKGKGSQYAVDEPFIADMAQCSICKRYTKEYEKWLKRAKKNNRK